MTVVQNIECSLTGQSRVQHARISKEERRIRIAKIIEQMQLTGLEKHKPSQLSGGQQQRVALGRILIGSPDIILMDEPMNALDTYLKERLRQELMGILSDFGKDVIIVTHDRTEAYEMCENLCIMDNGRVVASGSSRHLFEHPGSRIEAVLTGCKNIAEAKKVSDHELFVPAWGIRLKTEDALREGLTGVGIRAHYLYEDERENAFPVTIAEMVEQPFEWILKFRYEGQDPASDPVWWRIPKSGEKPPLCAGKLGVNPRDVLPLYG